jgi:hypothetical protein
MKIEHLAALICAVSAVSVAQTSTPSSTQASKPAPVIRGSGQRGYLPKFSGPSQINDSTILQSADGNLGIGTTAPLFPLHIFNGNTTPPPGQYPTALYVETPVSVDGTNSVAIQGLATSNSGSVFGVLGTTYSPGGIAVFGNNTGVTGGGGGGVEGITSSADFGFSFAIRGDAIASTGSAVALFAQTYSPDGTAGYFLNRAGGNIIVGHVGQNDDQSVFRVDGTGRVFADGGFQPNGADFAESMAVTGNRSGYAAGDLLVIDPTSRRHLALAQKPYSTLVAGIYSTKPGMLGSTRNMDAPNAKDEIPLAVVGIVPCKVTTENGPIHAGDLLVASSTRGHAMKGTDRARMLGAVVGKALEPLPTGTGVIQVLVTLQ